MAVLVLQAFAVQRRAAGGAAEQEAARAHVAGGPGEVADALEAEHRVEDVEGDHLHAVRRVRRRRGDPVAHAPGLVDALLQDLPVLALAVEHQLVGVLRRVELPLLVPDAELAEHPLHAERARLVRHDRHDVLADGLVADQHLQHLHEGHRRRDLALVGALGQALERGERRHGHRLDPLPALRQVAAERHAALAHVREFLAALGEREVGNLLQLVVGHRQAEAVAEAPDRLDVHLLLLVRDVLRLAGRAHAEALDRLGEDHRRLALVVDRLVVGGVHLERVEPAAVQRPDVVVRPVARRDRAAPGSGRRNACGRRRRPWP